MVIGIFIPITTWLIANMMKVCIAFSIFFRHYLYSTVLAANPCP